MLATLRIRNLALASDLSLDLEPGYNVITGETGAGKSIIIGALNLILGERADRNLIRSGSDSCSVEAVFEVSRLRAPVASFLDEHGLEPSVDGALVLKRTFSATGVTRQFINGSPATLNLLSALGQWLVDLHGPHEHQSLLQAGQQLAILDAFGHLDTRVEQFSMLVRQLDAVEREKSALILDESAYARQVDLLRFQCQEIEGARLKPDEESQLEQDHARARDAAKLLEICQSAILLISEDDTSLLTQTRRLGKLLQDLRRTDPRAAPFIAVQEEALARLSELQSELSRYGDRLNLDPARLAELEEHMNRVQGLKRKYGPSLAKVIEFGRECREKLAALEQREEELSRLNAVIQSIHLQIAELGAELSGERRRSIPKLSKAVSKQLNDLGFRHCQFDVHLESLVPSHAAGKRPPSTGLDRVEFLFTPNEGEPPRPLRTIASSGEMARVMLALKTVLAKHDNVPVLIFDEVDANVGGETAHVVGRKMLEIGATHQVICITHLPPVAAPADAHYLVTKETKDGRTSTRIQKLEPEERVGELARMLGGQSDPVRRHAASLLQRNPPGA